MRKVPTTSVPISLLDIMAGLPAAFFPFGSQTELERAFAEHIGVRHCLAVNKGTTALYLGLLAMKKMSANKTEVILPAYTVPTLTLAINMAGLQTRLCDISPDTFNMDPEALEKQVSGKTLAVVPVHMFGFPCALTRIREICRSVGAFMLEDPAQAMGAELDGKKVGTYGDTALFSLCKGKVISTYYGGLAVTDNDEMALLMRAERERLAPAPRSWANPMILTAFALAMRPEVYGTLYPLIARYKSTTVHEHFRPSKYTDFQAAVALRLLRRLDEVVATRIGIGQAMYDALKEYDWLMLPQIVPGSMPVFNHLPVVFNDPVRLCRVEAMLWQSGIDTARMYQHPIHQIYDLGYVRSPDPFPNSTYVAERLLTLPSHPYMIAADVERIISVFRRADRIP